MSTLATKVSWNQATAANGGYFSDNMNISNGFRTLGLVNTSDTGQNQPSDGGVAANGPNCYELFKFADSLQATYPVIFKIIYVGSLGYTNPQVAYQIQVGTATDGAGNFTGFNCSPLVNFVPQWGNGPVYAQNSLNQKQYVYMSGSTDRITMAIGEGPDVLGNLVFNIERTKNTSGADTSDGIIFQWVQSNYNYIYCAVNGSPSIVGNMVIPFAGTVAGFNTVFNAPIQEQGYTLASATDYVASLSITPFNFQPYNAGLGLQLYYSSDFSMYVAQTISMYGANHTYLPLNQNSQYRTGVSNPLQLTNPAAPVSLMMRYE